ncbi:MAG TPA: hypothetical protein VFQ61_35680, partial [Polyangiaceae bacterium]|nr:hypothetical protein [Polyangiaceae bacterium]
RVRAAMRLHPFGVLLLFAGISGMGARTEVARANEQASRADRAPEHRNDRVLEQLAQISRNLRESKYNHVTRVNEREGRYEFDCSGFVTWVLRRVAPGAYAAVMSRSKTGRPVARDYYWEFARAPTARSPRGVLRIERVAEAQAGDIVAWLKPALVQSPNTGHVGFLLERPRPVPQLPGGYLVRIADASSYQHQDDDRSDSGRTGFGSGTILLVANLETGAAQAYGWFGLQSYYVLETPIAIGRVTR